MSDAPAAGARPAAPAGSADARRLVLAALGAYFVALLALALAGVALPWRLLGVPQLSPAFADLHNVLAAVACDRAGHDVLRVNPCDALGRPMNYPRAWLALGALGLGPEQVVPAGVALAVLFLGAALAVLGRLDRRGAALAALFLCSPSVMLLVERGNVDAVIFVACAAAAALGARERSGAAGAAVLTGAAALKLFPVFALPAPLLVRDRRLALVLAAAGGLVFLAYAWWIRDDLRAIAAVVPQSADLSYGANVPLRRIVGPGAPDLRPGFVGLAAALAAAGAWRGRAPALPLAGDVAGRAFAIGALVYVGSFALGTSWAYRLAFLVLLLPQLARWRAAGGGAGRLAVALAAAAAVALWCIPAPLDPLLRPPMRRNLWYAGQLATWSLAALLAFTLGTLLRRAGDERASGAAAGPAI